MAKIKVNGQFDMVSWARNGNGTNYYILDDKYQYLSGASNGTQFDVLKRSGGRSLSYLGNFTDTDGNPLGTTRNRSLNWKNSEIRGLTSWGTIPQLRSSGLNVKLFEISDISVPGSVYFDLARNQSNWSKLTELLLIGNDTIDGSAWDDFLVGGQGNDKIDGGTGSDWMDGGAGDDVYYVDNMSDRCIDIAGDDIVFSRTSYTIESGIEKLTLLEDKNAANARGNSLSNVINGNSFNNKIEGNDGDDFLVGGGGSDEIFGGYGVDVLTGIDLNDKSLGKSTVDKLIGGNGNDLFIMGNASGCFYSDGITNTNGRSDYAIIQDFNLGDKIQLFGKPSDYILKANDGVARDVSGLGIYLNNSSGVGSLATGWDSKDELLGLIQTIKNYNSTIVFDLSNSAQFTYV